METKRESSAEDVVSDCSETGAMTFPDNEHVTIWVRSEKRKIAGNAAPLGRNLKKYLSQREDCEIYNGQDIREGAKPRKRRRPVEKVSTKGTGESDQHVPIWNRVLQRKLAGNASPLARNLEQYLAVHPEAEIYNGQDIATKRMKSTKKDTTTAIVNKSPSQPPMDPWLIGTSSPDTSTDLESSSYYEDIDQLFGSWNTEEEDKDNVTTMYMEGMDDLETFELETLTLPLLVEDDNGTLSRTN